MKPPPSRPLSYPVPVGVGLIIHPIHGYFARSPRSSLYPVTQAQARLGGRSWQWQWEYGGVSSCPRVSSPPPFPSWSRPPPPSQGSHGQRCWSREDPPAVSAPRPGTVGEVGEAAVGARPPEQSLLELSTNLREVSPWPGKGPCYDIILVESG